MNHRITKVANHYNRPIKVLVEVLNTFGHVIEAKPTSLITEEMVTILSHYFATDPPYKGPIIKAEKISNPINEKPTTPFKSHEPTTRKGDGPYQIPFKKLKFKDGTIYIKFDDIFLGTLTYKPKDLSIYKMIISHYNRSNEFLGVTVSNKKILKIDNEDILLRKLNLSKPKKIIDQPFRANKSKGKTIPLEKAPKKRKRNKNRTDPKPIPESQISKPKKRPRIPNKTDNIKIPESNTPKPQLTLPIEEIKLKANLHDIASFYGVTTGDIINYLRSRRNRKFYPLSSKLSAQEVDIIQAHFTPRFRKKNPSAPLFKIVWTDLDPQLISTKPSKPPIPLPEPEIVGDTPGSNQKLSIKSSFEDTMFDFELKRDKFTTSVGVIKYPGLSDLLTFFSDREAQDICSKMSSSLPRKRASDFDNPNNKNKELLRYEIHYMANKALNIFGGKILTLISDLRKLKFKTRNAIELRTYRNVHPDFPFLHFNVGVNKVNVAFFTKLHRISNKLTSNSIIYSSKYQRIGFMDELGRIKLELSNFRPQLSLFIEKVSNMNYTVYSGVETGACDICGHQLTHPTSLLFGIGPVCAKNLNIDLKSLNIF